jgi:hypothetical protein
VAVAVVVATILVVGAVVYVERGTGPADGGSGAQVSPPISRPVDVRRLTGQQADSTLDPSFTGGPAQQPNMGTKPPSSSASPSASSYGAPTGTFRPSIREPARPVQAANPSLGLGVPSVEHRESQRQCREGPVETNDQEPERVLRLLATLLAI